MSSQNKQCLAALAMDLKRVALGYYHGSNKTAERFFDEALERRREIELSGVKPYVRKLLLKLDSIKKEKIDEIVKELDKRETELLNLLEKSGD